MKRSWFSIVLVGAVIGLLTLFLGLQYKWLSEISNAERERMQRRVETDAARLAEDFDREMQAAYYNFQAPGGLWKDSEWEPFNARYDFWKERTAYPELIRNIYFIRNDPNAKPERYDTTARAFVPDAGNAQLDDLRQRIVQDKNGTPVYTDMFATVLPIYNGAKRMEHIVLRRKAFREVAPVVTVPEKFGWLVIMLDERTIKERILPELYAKYFPDGDYRVSVLDNSDQTVFATQEVVAVPDASAKMFNLSPDNLMFFAETEGMPRVVETHRKGVIVNQKVESHTFSRIAPGNTAQPGMFNVELRRPPEKRTRTSIMSTDEVQPWTLRVQHSAGSIDSFVTNKRNKSFLIGFGIYLLLVGGIMAILLSAMRSRAFARRQIDFVSSVSHEFRTPLAVIYSAGENLADGVAKEEGQVSRYGQLIKGEGKKLSAMVEQILEFAGANSGKQKYRLSSTDVKDVVNDALSECRPLIESGGFTVETDLQPNLPKISADRTALSGAIQNLIANSMEYANGSTWIKVSAKNGGGNVKIAVGDKGLGIGSADLRQIFEPFYRAKQVVDAQISGNGLGLNLVKKIVEAHDGRISVESTPGVGSTFTIDLPQQSPST